MHQQHATKSWIFAGSVTAILLLCLTQQASAETQVVQLCDSSSFSGEKILLARGDAMAPVPQRRTYVSDNPAAEANKQSTKEYKGIQGPAGKIPAESGPQGKSPSPQHDALRVTGDAADGCSKHLRCSGD